jgi:hypothetical protein
MGWRRTRLNGSTEIAFTLVNNIDSVKQKVSSTIIWSAAVRNVLKRNLNADHIGKGYFRDKTFELSCD